MLLPRRFPFVFSSTMFLPSSIPVERTLAVSVAQEFGKNPTGKKGRKVATRSRSSSCNCSAVQSRESSIDVAKHMLRSRREKGDWIYARRAQYLLSSWHSHLSSKAATKKGVLVLYRVATTILALTITERPMVVDHVRAGGGGCSWIMVVVYRSAAFHHQIRLPPIRFFSFLVSVTLKPFSAYVTGRREKSSTSISVLFLLQIKCRGLILVLSEDIRLYVV